MNAAVAAAPQSLRIGAGQVRLRVQTTRGRTMLIGPFGTLAGARRLAEDLISETPSVVRSVRVEHHNRIWKPAWTVGP